MEETEVQKPYVDLYEAARAVGLSRATMYNYLSDLNIQTYKIGRSRRTFIKAGDLQQLLDYKASPWLFKVSSRKKTA